MDVQCTQEFSEYSVVYTRLQNAFLCDLYLTSFVYTKAHVGML